MTKWLKNLLLWLLIGCLLVIVFSNTPYRGEEHQKKVTYSAFLKEVESGNVARVSIKTNNITAIKKDKSKLEVYLPLYDRELLPTLMNKGVEVIGLPPDQPSMLVPILLSLAPVVLYIIIFMFFTRQMGGGGGSNGRSGPLSFFGRSRARLLNGDQVTVTFDDVAGIDEAKADVEELVAFLKDPKKFQKLGGRVPCGVLLLGQPGTGKTLLAKAVAGEAKVPFYSISGSDFVEMFVGVGASRVRDLFENAKKHSPCIIFIDEIDAVGRHRGAGVGGGHDEREQTLNQLLVEMDGFVGKDGVIVIAATNRADVLDPALLRPGRFDRQIVVSLPDIHGRAQILKVHVRKIPLAPDVDLSIIARSTPGFSGADLSNLVNEAALFASRLDKKHVELADFEKAKDKILMGTERRSIIISNDEKRLIAYHEAGHIIVGYSLLEYGHDPIYKASIIPRGHALGVTMFLPEEDRYNYSKQRLEAQISGLFGGRVAEIIKFGPACMTTGAANDIERTTSLARNMVTKWGLSEKLGPIVYGNEEGEIFLGRTITAHKEISDATASEIDYEIRAIIKNNYERAEQILTANLVKLDRMAEALIKYETINVEQINTIMAGREIQEMDPAAVDESVSDLTESTPATSQDDSEITSESNIVN